MKSKPQQSLIRPLYQKFLIIFGLVIPIPLIFTLAQVISTHEPIWLLILLIPTLFGLLGMVKYPFALGIVRGMYKERSDKLTATGRRVTGRVTWDPLRKFEEKELARIEKADMIMWRGMGNAMKKERGVKKSKQDEEIIEFKIKI